MGVLTAPVIRNLTNAHLLLPNPREVVSEGPVRVLQRAFRAES
jgi:hypothetical protein